MFDLRHGKYQDVMQDVTCAAVIADPPYGARTHDGNADMGRFAKDGCERTNLSYAAWTPDDVAEFVQFWSPRTSGWITAMTSDDLIPVWRDCYSTAGRLDFAPVPILQHRPRMGGDGPGSGAVYLMVARPREKRFLSWGSLPCWYGPFSSAGALRGESHIGGKPVALMREIVRDYSRQGDIVADPCMSYGSTGAACIKDGRSFIGSEVNHDTFSTARSLLDPEHSPLFMPTQRTLIT